MAFLATVGVWLHAVGEGGGAGARKPESRAGWLGVFPELPGYQRTFTAPVVAAGKQPESYRQLVKYEWTGGAVKMLQVTLARDPAFKKTYAADTLRKEAKEVKVGKRTGWLWNFEKQAGGKLDALMARLVVPLAEDKALIFEARGIGPWEAVTDLAARFDLASAETALAAPPRTDFQRSLDAFRALKKGIPLTEVIAWVGDPDRDVGSGMLVMEYKLADGSRVLVGFVKRESLMYVNHEGKDGKVTELVK
jgi:hypothetical protein